MQLKKNISDQKLRGGYYTPEVLADFIVKNIEINKEINILEPSCGDGIFINSIKKIIPKEKIKSLTAIEIIKEEANKVKNRFKDEKFHILNEDFLNFYRNNRNKRFDLIIGNPPYIRYQYLSKEQRELQSEILKNNSIKPNKLINSWVCFLVACIELLDDKGTIGFVIPAELLQVAYAEELRKHLSNNLAEIILITFKELVFPDIEQEVIVLIGKKDKSIPVNGAKIAVVEFNNFDDMQNKETFDNIEYQLIKHTEEKWTKYFLESNENELIRKIRKDDRFQTFNDIAIINVGITTGNNRYFSVNKETVKRYDLEEVVLPLIGRSSHAQGVYFTYEDWQKNINKNERAYLIHFPDDIAFQDYPELHKKYIIDGENRGENKGYKCKIRDRWYIVPSVWVPDAFFLRRNNKFPKFVLNTIRAVSTDTMHRVKFYDGIDKEKALLSYYNSITFAFTEINGRSYGGGVLELMPGEVGRIILPKIENIDKQTSKELINIIDDYIRNNKNIDELLDITDKAILHDRLGISEEITIQFRTIWKKLMNRRHNRSRKKKNL